MAPEAVDRARVLAVIAEADDLFASKDVSAALARLEAVAAAPAARLSWEFQARLGRVLAAASGASAALPEITASETDPPAPIVRWAALDLAGRAYTAYQAAVGLQGDPEVQTELRRAHGVAHLKRISDRLWKNRFAWRVEIALLAHGLARVNLPAPDARALAKVRQFSAESLREACARYNEAVGDVGRPAAWGLWARNVERPFGDLGSCKPPGSIRWLIGDRRAVQSRRRQIDIKEEG